ncbi:MAG: restriction endonuclease subunit S [Bacteroidetes bacterium]|nr:restriction endonuclease subunit S [Bacteroidota bacterium]
MLCREIKQEKVNRKYLVYALGNRNIYDQLVGEIHGATRPRINTTQLKSCIIPIPPLEEQHRIVQEIESRLSVCDAMEATLQTSLAQAEVLRQSILKRAFEGRLG